MGQRKSPDGSILDAYEVTYEGLDKRVTLLLDWYHYDQPKAPRGFSCGQPFNLWPPPVSPFQESDDLVALAFEHGASRDFEPIPLASQGTTYGSVFDRFRLLALASRAAAAKGVTLAPQAPPSEAMQQGMLVVAHPRACDARTVRPTSIDVVAPNGALMPKRDELVLADRQAIAPYLPGVEVPEGSIALRVPSGPRARDSVRIRYAEPCGDLGTESTIPMTVTPARALEMPRGTAPDGTAPATAVLMQALIDLDGRFTRATYVGGPRMLEKAATETLGSWRAEPARINGAPTPAAVIVEVRLDPPR